MKELYINLIFRNKNKYFTFCNNHYLEPISCYDTTLKHHDVSNILSEIMCCALQHPWSCACHASSVYKSYSLDFKSSFSWTFTPRSDFLLLSIFLTCGYINILYMFVNCNHYLRPISWLKWVDKLKARWNLYQQLTIVYGKVRQRG